ncbi:MAG: hypothetical protein AAFV09_18500, partial [Pseudomonadota bacterium]
MDADQIVPRFGMPANPAVRAAVEAWLPSIAHIRDPFLRLDLAYLELRMGCWAFAQAYVAPGLPEVSPMISRRCFQAMLSLPPDWRRGNRMILDSVRLAWPELLELPARQAQRVPLGRAELTRREPWTPGPRNDGLALTPWLTLRPVYRGSAVYDSNVRRLPTNRQ